MAGDVTNARLWTNASVWVSFDLDEADPANIGADFAGGWEEVGLLDGDDGFTETRDEDVSDHFSWGGILTKTGRAHFKLTKKFSCNEEANDVVFRLRWPGSTKGGQIVVPVPEKIKIAFETIEGGTSHRLISANYAEVSVDGDITENETDLTKVQFVATIYPDASVTPGVLFNEQNDDTDGS